MKRVVKSIHPFIDLNRKFLNYKVYFNNLLPAPSGERVSCKALLINFKLVVASRSGPQAGLAGETISGSISYEPPPPPYTWFDPDTGSAVVGGGIEFIYNDGWLNIPIDAGAWSVHIDVINISPNL